MATTSAYPGRAKQRPSKRPQSRSESYEHLRPLFTDLANLRLSRRKRQQLRARLVTGHLPVAQHIARRFSRRGQPVEDLTQVATVGLINAVDRFDPERGTDFLSFAVPTIVGEVRRHFRDNTWSMRVPRRLKELHAAITTAIGELSQRYGHSPRPSEIAEHLDISLEEVLEGLQVSDAYASTSLDDGIDARPAVAAAAAIEEPGLDQVENRAALYPALAKLPERERKIVFLRFFENMTQTQIAKQVGVSQMHVSRLLAKSLERLRGLMTPPVSR